MNSARKWIERGAGALAIVALAVVGWTFANLSGREGSLPPGLRPGDHAPEITGQSTNGKSIALSGFVGKVVLIDFWGTWCPPCRETIPHSKELYHAYEGRPFIILGIGCEEKAEDLKTFVDWAKLPWPNLFDDGAVAKQWKIDGFPTFVLVNHRGVIVGRWDGADRSNEIDNAIAKAVREAEKQ